MKKSIWTILVAIGLFAGCSEEEVRTYSEDVSGIFFQRLTSWTSEKVPVSYADSVKFSFTSSSEKITQTVYKVPVLITGKSVGYDRKIKLLVDEERTTAVLDKHYTINTDTLYVKANSCRCDVPVTLLRHPDLLTQTFRIVLKVEENENFKILVDEYKSSHDWTAKGTNLDATHFKIIFDEKYAEPNNWGTMYTFGDFSAAKYLLVNELMGWTAVDWQYVGVSGHKIGAAKAPYAALQMQKELQRLADAGEPLKDENGKYVQLPEPYDVDYSHYE